MKMLVFFFLLQLQANSKLDPFLVSGSGGGGVGSV